MVASFLEELVWLTCTFFVEADFSFLVYMPRLDCLVLGKDPYGKRSLLIHSSEASQELLVSSNNFE